MTLLSIETAAELRLPLTTFVTHGEVAMSFKSVASYIQSIAPRGKMQPLICNTN